MCEFEVLTKEEAMLLYGGGKAYRFGYRIGAFFSDLVDWYEGFSDGFKGGFDGNN